MLIYTGNTSDKSKLAKIKQYGMGVMITSHPDISFAKSFLNNDLEGVPLALDNGAFGGWKNGYGWNPYPFYWTLNQVVFKKLKLNFLVCPDRPAHPKSLMFSQQWAMLLPWDNLALACQDGMDPKVAMLPQYSTIFMGGTVEWKLKNAKAFCEVAHDHGKQFHIGRVGSLEGYEWAEEVGADSVDGTNIVRNDAFHLVKTYQEKQQQKMAFE